MGQPQSSIIIPVYNNWDFTRKCLKSIAANTDPEKIEVIVIDNASTDATEKGCPFLGKQLFGDRFQYLRNQKNRNFAGASNQGAELAKGEYLIFLNNDTEVQPGWYEPLVNDFSSYPDIGATGPLLLYPEDTPLGKTVQHLGVIVTSFMKLGHLYNQLPALSPLARKRRFFQVITAACLVMHRELFFRAGKFDEDFINGYEDVDLCARLTAMGLRMTVNPESVVIHHEGKSQGRHAGDDKNYQLLTQKSLHQLKPDWHKFLTEDGNNLIISQWLTLDPVLSIRKEGETPQNACSLTDAQLRAAIQSIPYWEAGWDEYLCRVSDMASLKMLIDMYVKFFPWPENLLKLAFLPQVKTNRALRGEILNRLKNYPIPSNYVTVAQQGLEQAEKHGLADIASQCRERIKNYAHFSATVAPSLRNAVQELEKEFNS